MTTFDDRERAFESLFARDQELGFRAEARRNRDIGLWAARQLGRDGDDAALYAGHVLMASVEAGGTEAVVAKIAGDLRDLGITERQIRRRMDELLAEAADHVKRS